MQNELSLYQLLDVDYTTLISENISLDAINKVYQALGLLSHQICSVEVARYSLTYGGYHILSSGTLCIKIPQ